MAGNQDDFVLPDLDELMGTKSTKEYNTPINPSDNKSHNNELLIIEDNSDYFELPELNHSSIEHSPKNNNDFELEYDNFSFQTDEDESSDDNFSFDNFDDEVDFANENNQIENNENHSTSNDDLEFFIDDNDQDSEEINDAFDFDDAFNVNLDKNVNDDISEKKTLKTNNEEIEEEFFSVDEDDENDNIIWDDEDNNEIPDDEDDLDNSVDDEEDTIDSIDEDDESDKNVVLDNDKESNEEKDKNKNLKNKFNQFKRQALAELKGKDADDVNDDNGSEEISLSDDNLDGDEDAKPKGSSKTKIPLIFVKPVSFIKNTYHKIINFVVKILQTILNFLGKIPIIGKPFKILADKVKWLKIIANLLPLFVIFMIVVHMHNNAINNHTSISGPDGGAGNISKMVYDKETNSVKAHIKNEGDVILDITPKFTLYTSKITNPGSWIRPKIDDVCIGNKINIDIDAEKDIIVKCKSKPKGLDVKVSGEAEYE